MMKTMIFLSLFFISAIFADAGFPHSQYTIESLTEMLSNPKIATVDRIFYLIERAELYHDAKEDDAGDADKEEFLRLLDTIRTAPID